MQAPASVLDQGSQEEEEAPRAVKHALFRLAALVGVVASVIENVQYRRIKGVGEAIQSTRQKRRKEAKWRAR